LWLVVAVALLIAEAFTGTFVLVMLGAGALAAALVALADGGPVAQGIVFTLVSALSLVVVRPALRRHLAGDEPSSRMGVQAIEGGEALVLEQIDADQGLVKIEGETWRARAFDGSQVIPAGERVRVMEIKGATALVWRD
jgi:membrane protein implicated in regulation of membrane protease activity